MKRTICLFLITVFLLAGLSGCGDSTGSKLAAPLPYEPQCLDPQISTGSSELVLLENCYECLTRLGEDGRAVPAAAESCDVSADGLVYTFKLRQNLKWHLNSNHEAVFGENYEQVFNNTLNAYDFVFGLRRALLPETGAPDASLLYPIKNARQINLDKANPLSLGVAAADANTLVITLEKPFPSLPEVLAKPIAAPCSETFFVASKGKYGRSAEYVLCNGEFYLSRWYKGSSIVLRTNPDNENSALPYSVSFGFTTDGELILDKLLNDGYDFAPLEASQLQDAADNGLAVTEIKNTTWGIMFNCGENGLPIAALRSALICSTDYSLFEDGTFSNRALWAVPPSCTVADASFIGQVSYAPGNTYDAKKAAENFNAALNALGKSAEVTVLCIPAHEKPVRRMIQLWQKTLGPDLAAKVEVVADEAALMDRLESGNFLAALAPVRAETSSAVEFLRSFTTGNRLNPCGFSAGDYDKLLEQLQTVSDTGKILDGCMQAQYMLLQNGVFCPVFNQSNYYAVPEGVDGVAVLPSGETVNFARVTKK